MPPRMCPQATHSQIPAAVGRVLAKGGSPPRNAASSGHKELKTQIFGASKAPGISQPHLKVLPEPKDLMAG